MGDARPIHVRLSERRDESGGPFACWPRTHPNKRFHLTGAASTEIRRAAWLVHHGSLPPMYRWVEVICGNVLCLNPWHLAVLTDEDRFWRYVKRNGPDACWPWIGPIAKYRRGYGQFKRDGRRGKSENAHRIAWELTHGAPPDHLFVCHRCDNPPCCNPAHLFLGTPKENSQDMIAKGRHAHGPEFGAKVRAAQIAARQRKCLGAPQDPK